MPGHVHTPLPDGDGHYGERIFAERAIAAADEKTHFWFGLKVPGGNDIDVLVLHEDIGAFVIEIKAVPIDGITNYDLDTCDIRGRARDRHPVRQASWAMNKLRAFLEDLGVARPPFFFVSAGFPRITRASMVDRWGPTDRTSIAGRRMARHYESLLFSDDLTAGAFLDRLRHIRQDPPEGPSPKRAAPQPGQVRDLIEATTGRSEPVASTADAARARYLTNRPGRNTSRGTVTRYLEPGRRAPVVLRGYPGTGKTLYLLDIAIAHAEAGRQVLFTCYNKVLGSSLRASLRDRSIPAAVADRVLVADVFAIRKGFDEHGLESLRGTFGTVCVDEAQDMGDEQFGFVTNLAAAGAEWFMADGEGQELYDPPSRFLVSARESGVTQQLNRRFRGTQASNLVAQAVFETELDRSRIDAWVGEHPVIEEDTLETGVEAAGGLPIISRINRQDFESREYAYFDELAAELEILRRIGSPFDLTVMVSRKLQDEVAVIRKALTMLGAPYLDQIADGNRRRVLEAGHVRLATVHSARGIESTRAVVFARGHQYSGKPGLMPARVARNAGYIAMSRAKHGTRVVLVNGDEETDFSRFVTDVVARYEEARRG